MYIESLGTESNTLPLFEWKVEYHNFRRAPRRGQARLKGIPYQQIGAVNKGIFLLDLY